MGKPALPIGVHSPGFVADTDAQARDQFWPSFKIMRDRIGAERGWPPMRREEFEAEVSTGSLYLGSPETVARRIAATISGLGVQRRRTTATSGQTRSIEATRAGIRRDGLAPEALTSETSKVRSPSARLQQVRRLAPVAPNEPRMRGCPTS